MLAVRSAKNTLGCLIGCAIETWVQFIFFDLLCSSFDSIGTLDDCLDISNEFDYDSVILETIILWRQLGPIEAFKTAIGMSMISMLLMEIAMNVVDYGMMGEPAITLGVLPYTLVRFLCLAHNYWRLKKHGKCCH